MRTSRVWSSSEVKYLVDQIHNKTIEQIAFDLKRSVDSVRLKLHRLRITPNPIAQNNLFKSIILAKFSRPEYFSPTNDFFQRTGISRKRFWKLYRGEIKASNSECIALVRELGVDSVEMLPLLESNHELFV